MKVVIAGSRTFAQLKDEADRKEFLVRQAAYKRHLHDLIKWLDKPITHIISGLAIGPDTWGMNYAIANNIDVIEMPANWTKYGKAAGPIRNGEMAKIADFAIVLWDGVSPGSLNMVTQMKTLKKPYVLQIL